MNDLGTALAQGGRHADAIAAYRAAYEASRERAGASHPVTATYALNLGSALMHTDDPARRSEAAALFAAARTVREAVFGPDDAEVAEVLLSEGALARRSGDVERAAATLRRAIEIFGGRTSSDLRAGMALNTLALLERGTGRLDAAEAALTDAAAVFERAGAKQHPSRLRAVIRRGDVRLARGDIEGARADLDTATALVQTTSLARPDDHAELDKLRMGLAAASPPSAAPRQ
jgi:tetratricopeptide (TPR) repeat protein